MLAREVGDLLAQQAADRLDRLLEEVEPLAGRRERDAVGGVLVERPPGAEPEVGPPAGQVVDRGDGVGQHGGVPVAGAVDERPDPHPGGVAGEGGVAGDGLVALVAVEVGGVEVVPDRDPVEPVVLDAGPEVAELVDRGVLQAGVHPEGGHGRGTYSGASPPFLTARSRAEQDGPVTTGTAPSNGIEIAYETHGDPDDEPLLLVMGLGAQLIAWPIELVDALVDRGFHVIRYDNRDVGLSTKLDGRRRRLHGAVPARPCQGQPVEAPYQLTDMAADGIGLLDHLGIESAHIVGASMGGMIVQTMAIEHPTRVRTLTSASRISRGGSCFQDGDPVGSAGCSFST